jgi:hypothetical protein
MREPVHCRCRTGRVDPKSTVRLTASTFDALKTDPAPRMIEGHSSPWTDYPDFGGHSRSLAKAARGECGGLATTAPLVAGSQASCELMFRSWGLGCPTCEATSMPVHDCVGFPQCNKLPPPLLIVLSLKANYFGACRCESSPGTCWPAGARLSVE